MNEAECSRCQERAAISTGRSSAFSKIGDHTASLISTGMLAMTSAITVFIASKVLSKSLCVGAE